MIASLYRWRWWIWLMALVAWTVLLVAPLPPHGTHLGGLTFNLRSLVAKSTHVVAYAFLTALAGWMKPPVRYRFLIIFGLMAHATLSEVLQSVLDFWGRSGSLQDVAWDQLGIALGIVVTWRRWMQAD